MDLKEGFSRRIIRWRPANKNAKKYFNLQGLFEVFLVKKFQIWVD